MSKFWFNKKINLAIIAFVSITLLAIGGFPFASSDHEHNSQKKNSSFTSKSYDDPAGMSLDDQSTTTAINDEQELTDDIYTSEDGEQCSEIPIPYETITVYDEFLPSGQQLQSGGVNGAEHFCLDSDGNRYVTSTDEPIDKTIRIGIFAPIITPTPAPRDPYYGVSPTRDDIYALLSSIGPAGSMRTEKISACQQLFRNRGLSDTNFQGFHVCSDYGLADYSTY